MLPKTQACWLPGPWQFSHVILARLFRLGSTIGMLAQLFRQHGRENPTNLLLDTVKSVVVQRDGIRIVSGGVTFDHDIVGRQYPVNALCENGRVFGGCQDG